MLAKQLSKEDQQEIFNSIVIIDPEIQTYLARCNKNPCVGRQLHKVDLEICSIVFQHMFSQ